MTELRPIKKKIIKKSSEKYNKLEQYRAINEDTKKALNVH